VSRAVHPNGDIYVSGTRNLTRVENVTGVYQQCGQGVTDMFNRPRKLRRREPLAPKAQPHAARPKLHQRGWIQLWSAGATGALAAAAAR
jgi:hypothetical protein